MEIATEKQLSFIRKNMPKQLRADITKQEAYKLIHDHLENQPVSTLKPINEAVLGMCFKIAKNHNQYTLDVYDEFLELKAKLEKR